ncbi:hypothetical protein [Terriglobus roseus]|uniref:hypothetical protein n=1 Tax=Terriglobus roseus TaxID=392734 RepID=UPI000942DC4B|nr:hypothetical protein [Terriglobus roseus]
MPYLQALWQKKLLLVLVPLLSGAILLGISYTRPKLYVSTVRFMPPARASATLLFAIGRSSGDEYRAELSSRTIGLDVVDHQHLIEYFKAKDADTAFAIVSGMSKFATDNNNFLTITVTSKDPKLSARVANEYFDALYRLNEKISASEAEHRLNFVSAPLEVERTRLRAAEEALRDAQQRTGLVAPSTQTTLGVQEIAELQNRISSLSAQLANARAGATDENPRVIALQAELSSVQAQVRQLQSKSSQVNSPAQLPTMALEVLRREREVQFHTTALDSLTKSLESVQVTESYTPSFAMIDPAFPAKNKSAPSHGQWLITGLAIGFLLVVTQVIGRTAYRILLQDEANQRRVMAYRNAFRSSYTRNAG